MGGRSPRKRTFWKTPLSVVLGLLLVACLIQAASGKEYTSFSHGTHAAKDISCTDCHGAVPVDTALTRVLPASELCQGCHSKETVTDWTPSAKGGLRAILFVHSQHADHLKDCTRCHKNLDGADRKAGGHETCGECHGRQIREMKCALCHRDMTSAGLSALNKYTHENNFLEQHGPFASRSLRVCAQCHRQRFCTECHSKRAEVKPSLLYPEAVRRNFIHKGDWITVHRTQARTDDTACTKCHALKECSQCHVRKNISPRSDTSMRRHPKNFLNQHGQQARRDILACASCHDGPGPGDCTTCHRASMGINPHPDGWNPGGVSQSDRMCAKCHGR